MKKLTILIMAVVMVLALLAACVPEPGESTPIKPIETIEPAASVETPSGAYLTPNPVEESMPIYGGVMRVGYYIPRTFDGHQYAGYGPTAQLPVFNQLVILNPEYKEWVLENLVGDLAESWETSEDGMEITFKLRQGVKWHDGVPFTANDVIYSLDKMNDVNRSAISDWFPAYESTEKIDDYTVKVHLKYPSASFLLTLAQGESQIQALHLAGTDAQSLEFMVGTGPFIITEYRPQVNIKYERNPDYWKKDQYGNQLPYLDGVEFYNSTFAAAQDALISRRLDMLGPISGAGRLDVYQYLVEGAPELLFQRRDRYSGSIIYLNTKHPPLDDIRVRRALGLVLVEEDLIIGYANDAMFGKPGVGILHQDFGLPEEEINELMGWDKPYEERVAEAQQLMADAGYPDGFKLNVLTIETTEASAGATLVFAEALRSKLNVDVSIGSGMGQIELMKRLDEDNYDTYTCMTNFSNFSLLDTYFGTTGYANWSRYSNPELDKMLAELDSVIDPDERREAIWAIERVLLTDLPALPTGCYIPNYIPYYPYVKNPRWSNVTYPNICRMEDIWIDESLRPK
ncbi:MAG: ABC transporter substrate-binding protein [Dehalococcoidales bacterium]